MAWCPVQNTEISEDLIKGHQKNQNRHLSRLRSTLKNTILPVMVAPDCDPEIWWQINLGYIANILPRPPKKGKKIPRTFGW